MVTPVKRPKPRRPLTIWRKLYREIDSADALLKWPDLAGPRIKNALELMTELRRSLNQERRQGKGTQ